MDSTLHILAAAGTVAEPASFGLKAYQWVSLAMGVLFAIFIWKKVPSMITRGLDDKIEAIKQQLDEAKNLRAEAEALRDEYAAKIAGAEKDAESMMENAKREAEAIVSKAETESAAMVARRERMAADKIAAAERDAVAEVRERAVEAAASASKKLIADKHGKEADSALADEVIASL